MINLKKVLCFMG